MARLIEPFGVRPGTIRTSTSNAKGYYLGDFADAFTRYLVDRSVTASQSVATMAPGPFASVTAADRCDGSKTLEMAEIGPCDGVTDQRPQTEDRYVAARLSDDDKAFLKEFARGEIG